MIGKFANENEIITPGTKVVLSADKDNVCMDANGDYFSIMGLIGVFWADMLMDIASFEPEHFEDAAGIAENILQNSIEKARDYKEKRGNNYGKH